MAPSEVGGGHPYPGPREGGGLTTDRTPRTSPRGLSNVDPSFTFDEVSASETSDLRAQSRRSADILGVAIDSDSAASEDVWLYADPSHERFGEVLMSEHLAGGRALLCGGAGLVEEDSSEDVWPFKRVLLGGKASWFSAKRTRSSAQRGERGGHEEACTALQRGVEDAPGGDAELAIHGSISRGRGANIDPRHGPRTAGLLGALLVWEGWRTR